MEDIDGRRPAEATVLAVMLALLAVATVVLGMLVSWASSCCGSTDPSDPRPAVAGVLVSGVLGVAAFGLIRGGMRPWLLVAMTAVVPVVCLAGAAHSSDLAWLAPFALVGWVVFALVLKAASVSAWLGREP